MHPVSKDEVLAAIAGRQGLPQKAVMITFDDGYRSVFDFAMPMLRDRGIPAIAFVVAGLLDSDTPYWWVEAEELVRQGGTANGFSGLKPEVFARALKDIPNEQRLTTLAELRQSVPGIRVTIPQLRGHELSILESAGVSIGNHSLTHPCLPRCSTDKIESELTQAHEHLSAALGYAPQVFSYPNGDADERVAQTLLTLGYKAAFLFDHHITPLPPPDPLRISRLRVNSDSSLDRFRIISSGLHSALHHAQGKR
jgi:peptidoglycan/xylan/chitin deacetylase (PgdA/CDA1 family)